MKIRILTAALTLAASLAAPAGFASPHPAKVKKPHPSVRVISAHRFATIDRNRDRFVARNEWRNRDNALFNRLDVNHDGLLSLAEYQHRASVRPAAYRPVTYVSPTYVRQHINQFDINGDSVVTRSEWRGDWTSFRRIDVNRDGVLTRADYASRLYR
jgi:hypothetical protein